jgi:pimeloyl-ACP methyl ester carboxylesterase
MTGADMALLRWRLRRCGFRAVQFHYPSIRASIRDNAARLQRLVERLPGGEVHFVGHSLGGLVVRRFFHDFPQQRPGRVVTLGTPHTGSLAARRLIQNRIGRWLLGRAGEDGLLGGLPPWAPERALGVIAGSLPLGGAWVVGGLPRPHDGTVSVESTRLPGMADHLVLHVSHMGLLVSPEAARQTCHFLRHGRFG